MSSFAHPLAEDYNSSSRSPWDNLLADEIVLGSKEIPAGIPGLYMLALQGRWQQLATTCRSSISSTESTLELATLHVMALIKLKVWQEAFLQLERAKNIQPDQSLWPFALQWAHAELPAALGRLQDTFTRFYSLLESCSTAEKVKLNLETGQKESIWGSRKRRCSLALIALHTKNKQYKPALALINQLLIQDSDDVEAWSQAARVQMIIGDYSEAQRSIELGKAAAAEVEAEAETATSNNNNKNIEQGIKALNMDEAMLLLLTGKPSEAAELYQQTSKTRREPTFGMNNINNNTAAEKSEPCAVSLVNAAVCQAYATNLVIARRELESIFLERPLDVLTESAVANIATLYGVVPPIGGGGSGGNGGEDSRRKMGAWVATAAPDDFDLSCCKSGGPAAI